MAVRIVVDDLGLCQTDGIEEVLSPEVKKIHAVRERIRYRLLCPEPKPLLLHMSSAIFQRFADLEGQPGLVVDRFSPRRALRELLGNPPPIWLTDNLASALGLFDSDRHAPLEQIDLIDRVIALIDPDLVQAPDLIGVLNALSRQPPALHELLAIPEVMQWFLDRLQAIGMMAAQELLTFFRNSGCSPKEVYHNLALAILREHLDRLYLRDALNPDFALPPRLCSPTLVRQLPLLPLAEKDAAPYPDYLQRLLILAERRASSGGLQMQALADYVLQDWPRLFECFQTLFEQNPAIASKPLVQALSSLDGIMAKDLAMRMQEYLDHSHCDLLPRDASVKDVLRWSERYFQYAVGAFERHAEPDEQVGISFAKWVSGEQNRIIQSEYDWRVVTRTVEEELADGNLVILCVIDALGAIHIDLVELELRQKLGDQTAPVIKPLFAPLPTITEVGKIGVLTGRDHTTQSVDYEKALRERFAAHLTGSESLQIVKSWKDFRQALRPATRLLVCLDNRVDDDLHQCTEFRLHRERVRTVAAQLSDLIASWLLDAARYGLQATILITADHGATKVSRSSPPLPDTTPIERRLLRISADPEPVPEGFTYVANGASGGYLIPHGRVAFGSTANLLHGGLTPEEVLIPLILIARGGSRPSFTLHLAPAEQHCHAATDGWYATLCLSNSTNDSFFNLKAVAQAPFVGESPLISRLGPYGTQTGIILNITSKIEQKGRTQVPFELRYQPSDGAPYQRLSFQLDLDLAAHLMERTEAASQFDDFFDS